MEASVSAVYPRLYLYNEDHYKGKRYVWRGNLGLRNLDNLYRNDIDSLRFYSPNARATLVLFSRPNFCGHFRVVRGNANIGHLDHIIAGHRPQSLVMANCYLSIEEIRRIRRTQSLPRGYRVR